MKERKIYETGRAPWHLATRIQLAEKKLEPTADPAAAVRTRSGRLLDLYDWRETKHSRFVNADELKQQGRRTHHYRRRG